MWRSMAPRYSTPSAMLYYRVDSLVFPGKGFLRTQLGWWTASSSGPKASKKRRRAKRRAGELVLLKAACLSTLRLHILKARMSVPLFCPSEWSFFERASRTPSFICQRNPISRVCSYNELFRCSISMLYPLDVVATGPHPPRLYLGSIDSIDD